MKRIWILALAFICYSVSANAQTKALETARINTPNVRCEECKKRLTTYLDRYDGVQYLNINWHKGEITVKYLTDRTNIEVIKTAIANAGYDADDIPANPEAYQKLPKTCKKFEDGGGHPKPRPPVPASAQ